MIILSGANGTLWEYTQTEYSRMMSKWKPHIKAGRMFCFACSWKAHPKSKEPWREMAEHIINMHFRCPRCLCVWRSMNTKEFADHLQSCTGENSNAKTSENAIPF